MAMDGPQKVKSVLREGTQTEIMAEKTNKKGIVLLPQPTNDPNEPLVRLTPPPPPPFVRLFLND